MRIFLYTAHFTHKRFCQQTSQHTNLLRAQPFYTQSSILYTKAILPVDLNVNIYTKHWVFGKTDAPWRRKVGSLARRGVSYLGLPLDPSRIAHALQLRCPGDFFSVVFDAVLVHFASQSVQIAVDGGVKGHRRLLGKSLLVDPVGTATSRM